MDQEARNGKADIAIAHLDAAVAAGDRARSTVSADNPNAAIDLIEVMHARMADAHRALDEIRGAAERAAAAVADVGDAVDAAPARAESGA